MKTHVLIVSRSFPATHKRKGDETNCPGMERRHKGDGKEVNSSILG